MLSYFAREILLGSIRYSETIDHEDFFPIVNPREMERVRRGTSELRPRNVKASRRPGRKTFLVIHPSTGTGQAKNVNYGSAVQPERPHAPPFPFHAESYKIWHRPSSFLFSFFFFANLSIKLDFSSRINFPNIEV